MNIQKMAPPQDKLHALLIEALENFEAASTKEASVHGIEETLAEDFKLGFHLKNAYIKSAFFRLLEMAILEMIR